MMSCKECQRDLPDYLFEPDTNKAVKRGLAEHLASCEECGRELAELRKTMNLLDAWEVPEPSPYFDQKLAVMMREEQSKAPAGWIERLRDGLLFNTGRQFRPAMIGAFALALLVGGGSFAGLTVLHHSGATIQASATVEDLQILDKDEQAIQQMDQLLQDDGDNDSDMNARPVS